MQCGLIEKVSVESDAFNFQLCISVHFELLWLLLNVFMPGGQVSRTCRGRGECLCPLLLQWWRLVALSAHPARCQP